MGRGTMPPMSSLYRSGGANWAGSSSMHKGTVRSAQAEVGPCVAPVREQRREGTVRIYPHQYLKGEAGFLRESPASHARICALIPEALILSACGARRGGSPPARSFPARSLVRVVA